MQINNSQLEGFLNETYLDIKSNCRGIVFSSYDDKKTFFYEQIIKIRKENKIKILSDNNFDLSDLEIENSINKEKQDIKNFLNNVISEYEEEEQISSWYKDKKNGLWKEYRKYLNEYKNIDLESVEKLDDSTNRILNSIKNYKVNKGEPIHEKGLVIGKIQSGKTTHMFTLISKLIDCKFDVIVILTGTHEDLRAQTQLRIEQDLFGESTDIENREKIGIGKFIDGFTSKFSLKTTKQLDVKKNQAFYQDYTNSNFPNVYCMKKNPSTIDALNSFANKLKGKAIVVIDDESDFASINTKSNESKETTKTNEKIRIALNNFDNSYYIAYTATPYANLFIAKGNDNVENIGEDLYPKSFIEVLSSPKEYTGFESFFNNNTWGNKLINTSLVKLEKEEYYFKVILDFIVSAAVKLELEKTRKMPFNSTLLINDNIKIIDHDETKDIVNENLNLLNSYIKYNHRETILEIEKILGERLIIIKHIRKKDIDISIDKVLKNIKSIFDEKPEVFSINSTGNKKLEEIFKDKKYVVIIGGHKISRGVTIEGLLVTSINRNISTQADVLSQAARWCGYRESYIDLMSIYTSQETIDSFEEVVLFNENLVEQINEMTEQKLDPTHYRFRFVKPKTTKITSSNKMRNVFTVRDTFISDSVQTLRMDITRSKENQKLVNYFATNKFGIGNQNKDGILYKNVNAIRVIKLLEEYLLVNSNDKLFFNKTNPQNWINYIEKMNKSNELINWTVVLKSNIKDQWGSIKIDNFNINLSSRKHFFEQFGVVGYKGLSMTKDEFLDLIHNENYLFDIENSKRKDARLARNPKDALLVIYFNKHRTGETIISLMISFPNTKVVELKDSKNVEVIYT